MARGPKKHLKRLNAPKHWMLDKMGGIWAPRPSAGPHKLRECLPLILVLRNRLKYALDAREVTQICMTRNVLVDGKIRTDPRYPAGFMDVLSIPKSNDIFRLLYDTKGRFVLRRINEEAAKYKLCKVVAVSIGAKKVPVVITNDGRTIRYPDPLIKVHDTVKIDLATGKIDEFVKLENGVTVMITKGRNTGRVGTLINRERHFGSFDIVQVKDAVGNSFATRLTNVFVIGAANKQPLVELPRGDGIKKTILETRIENEKRKQR